MQRASARGDGRGRSRRRERGSVRSSVEYPFFVLTNYKPYLGKKDDTSVVRLTPDPTRISRL